MSSCASNEDNTIPGTWKSPEINWTNCAEQMPPDDEMIVIVNHSNEYKLHRAMELWAQITIYGDHTTYTWTPYLKEKWEYLNR